MSLFGRANPDDIPAYTFGAYARDLWAFLLVSLVCVAGTTSMLSVLGIGAQARALVVGFVALCLLLLFVGGYLRKARFYRDMREYTAQVGQISQFSSLVEEPAFLEGAVSYQVIDHLSSVANSENAAEREQARAHREYIELWIHEVKTPIAAAKLMLSSMHGEQALKLRGELERIERQVDQALYSARATSLTNDYAIRSTPLADAAREACRKNAHFLIERGASVNVNVPDDVKVYADEPWLVFMLGQVVTNAAKYGAKTIAISSREEEPDTPRGRIVLEVRDDGCGIPAADVPRVFDRGFTGEVGRAQGSATGMGLYLTSIICENMGLGLGIASEEGVGTRVLFSFPHDRRRAMADPFGAQSANACDKPAPNPHASSHDGQAPGAAHPAANETNKAAR